MTKVAKALGLHRVGSEAGEADANEAAIPRRTRSDAPGCSVVRFCKGGYVVCDAPRASDTSLQIPPHKLELLFGDSSPLGLLPTGVLGRDKPKIGREFAGRVKPRQISQLGNHRYCNNQGTPLSA